MHRFSKKVNHLPMRSHHPQLGLVLQRICRKIRNRALPAGEFALAPGDRRALTASQYKLRAIGSWPTAVCDHIRRVGGFTKLAILPDLSRTHVSIAGNQIGWLADSQIFESSSLLLPSRLHAHPYFRGGLTQTVVSELVIIDERHFDEVHAMRRRYGPASGRRCNSSKLQT